jgi:hypothetical protein
MNKLVYGFLAGGLIAAPGKATDTEWLSLDQEIEALSASLNQDSGGGPNIYGWFQASWRYSNDDALEVETAPGSGEFNDLSGVMLDSVRLGVDGSVGDYGYRIEYDFADPSVPGGLDSNGDTFGVEGFAGLLDAYVTTMIADSVMVKVGNFRQPFVGGALIPRDRLLFLWRTGIDQTFADRDLGVQFSGEFETVDWYAAVQNGSDGQGDEYLFTGRVEVDVVGGGVGDIEGAWGAGDEVAATVGLAIADDGQVDDGLHWALDGAVTSGPLYFAAALVDFDDGPFGVGDPVIGVNAVDDTTPWNATLSYMFTDMYEAALRYEDADDDDDSNAISVSVNRYVQGHDIKWTAEWRSVDTDNAIDDFDIFGLGVSLSF